MDGGHVLVVDDVAANRFLYRALLEEDGHAVREASDGPGALAEVRRADAPAVELVLLDVSMPGMSGMEVLKALRAREGGPAVLMLTAAARSPSEIERGLALGADAYLTKPVENRELAARVRAALTIHRLRAELAALQRDQTAMLVHDLRHPLGTLLMLAETLDDNTVSWSDQREASAMIRRTVAEMQRLVDSVLTASRLEAGVFSVTPAEVSLDLALGGSLGAFAALAARRNVTLQTVVPPGLVVRADPEKLRQVLDNLLANALKFSPRGGSIAVTAAVEGGDRVRVSVRDAGPGVPPEEVPTMFERYRQGAQGRTRGGAGLGLAIARGIVEAHGGVIAYAPWPAGGAVFSFTLPGGAA
jgi:signal transduction histidine kinase